MTISITIKPQDVLGYPDGTAWSPVTWEYAPDSRGWLAIGHELHGQYEGSLSVLGQTTSYITDYVILDEYGQDVTDEYYVTLEPGVIQLKTKIIIKPRDVLGTPDGSEWYAYDWEYTEDTVGWLMAGHSLYCEYAGSRIESGKTESYVVGYTILDDMGNDVTDEYLVETRYGWVKVRTVITVKPQDVIGYPDGREWYASDWEYADSTVGWLAPDHQLYGEYAGWLVDIGETDSYMISYRILDVYGEDVTDEYIVMTETGTIRVKPLIVITVKPQDVIGYPDGREWRAYDWEYTHDTISHLYAGHYMYCEYEGALYDRGETNSTIVRYFIYDEWGNDVTDQYIVETRSGIVKVQAAITIKPVDVLGYPNGDNWYATNWEYTDTSESVLMSGHSMTCTYAGFLSEVGESVSLIISYTILDEYGNDVTHLYYVETVPGVIRVKPKLIIKPQDVFGYPNGNLWYATDWEYTEDSVSQLDPGHQLYASYEGALTEAGSTSTYISYYVILNDVGMDVTDQYIVETRDGVLRVQDAIAIKPQDVYGYPNGQTWAPTAWEYSSGTPDYLAPGHTLVCEFDGWSTDVGTISSYIVSYTILDEYGNDVSDRYTVLLDPGVIDVKYEIAIKPQDVLGVVNGQDWMATDWEYTSDSLNQLAPGHQLICGFNGSLYYAGRIESSIGYVVILDELGWDVTHNYRITYHTGTICVRTPITVKPVDVFGYTNGDTWAPTAWEYASYTAGYLMYGHNLVCEFSGSLINAGGIESFIMSYAIYDELGRDVTQEYVVETVPGTIQVQARITIKPTDVQAMYDGNFHAPEGWEYVPGSAQLAPEHQFVDVTFAGGAVYPIWPDDSIVDDDEYFRACQQPTYIVSYRIIDVNTNEDVTYLYDVMLDSGYVLIQGLEMNVTPKDYLSQYDGLVHTATQYKIDAVSKINGSTAWLNDYNVVVELIGSRAEYGRTEIIVGNVTVYDLYGNDVTPAFKINRKTATLQVYADRLTFETGSGSKTYDGTSLENFDYRLLSGALLSGHRLEVKLNSYVNAGHYTNTPTVTIYDEYGSDVTDWYYIDAGNSHYGTLIIERAHLLITSGSASAVYVPGQTLTCQDYSVVGNLAAGEILTVKITGSQTMPGKSENFIDWKNVQITRDGKDTKSNYEIEVKAGMLEVTAP